MRFVLPLVLYTLQLAYLHNGNLQFQPLQFTVNVDDLGIVSKYISNIYKINLQNNSGVSLHGPRGKPGIALRSLVLFSLIVQPHTSSFLPRFV